MEPHRMGKQSVAEMRPKSAGTSVAHSPEQVTSSCHSSLLLPGESYGQRGLPGYTLGVERVRHNIATKPPPLLSFGDFPLVAQTIKNLPAMWETRV